MSLLWLAIILFAGFLIIRAIFRAIAGPRPMPPGYGGPGMGGPGYGPPGYGGGYGPGYGGGVGGGFFSGLLGGALRQPRRQYDHRTGRQPLGRDRRR